jgi:RecA-family ATPase
MQEDAYRIITAEEASSMNIPDVEWIVEGFLPLGFKAILSGTTGSNKSYASMELGMRVSGANRDGSSEFLSYKIPKPLKVLYIDIEVGEDEMLRRYQRLEKSIGFKEKQNFGMISLEGSFMNAWPIIKDATVKKNPDLVIIDNLYSSTDKNMSKQQELKPVLKNIDELMAVTGVTPLLVHHFNKATGEMGMEIDRMQGASTLQNWAEYIILLSKTNKQDLRLMKVAKSRGTHQSEEVYGIRWDSETFTLKMECIIDDYQKYLKNTNSIRHWESALESMEEKFDTNDWVHLVIDMGLSRETAFNWLRELQTIGMIKKVKHGHYIKSGMKILRNVE